MKRAAVSTGAKKTDGQVVKRAPASADCADDAEEVLLDRARTGDMTACAALMRRYNQRLYRAIRSVLKTGSDVEDTMQDTYLAALRNLDQYEGRAPFGTWLLKIGTNAALARMRQRMRVMQLDDLPDLDDLEPMLDLAAHTAGTPEQQVSNSEIGAIVEEAIDRLPYDYRQVFTLRMIEGLDTTEAAEVLGLGEDAVRQRLHRAREMLQIDIQGQAGSAVHMAFGFLGRRCNRVVASVLQRLSENPINDWN
jgi:RNA polymerase sigma-70 factor (ECF subfamily)